MKVPVIAIIAVFVLNLLASITDTYTAYWWSDSVVHFLGGAASAYFFFVFLSHLNHRGALWIRSRWLWFFLVISCTMLVSVLWEFFEYADTFMRIFVKNPEFMTYFDTITDLFYDLVGASLAMILLIGFKRKTNAIFAGKESV